MSECETAVKCSEPFLTEIERPCQSSSCGNDDLSNYNPMKSVIV
ncbi:MAG: hypothetical protein RTV72_08860 [Candidatus Thorarchaeota archaeon]